MIRFVSFLPTGAIERDAEALLAEFAAARGIAIRPPIPIEDIIEKHLKLSMEFHDMHALIGGSRLKIGPYPDILGGISFREHRMFIDESLDPDADPLNEGRYRFTAAHEVGHWRLHRKLAGPGAAPSTEETGKPLELICRTSRKHTRIEMQANLYAAALLIPHDLILAAWNETFPDGLRAEPSRR